MSEPTGRANHKHGAVAFLATQWRVLIGADLATIRSFGPDAESRTHQ
jgi:hypothetical protein